MRRSRTAEVLVDLIEARTPLIVALMTSSGPARSESEYRLEEDGDHTLVRLRFTTQLSIPAAVLGGRWSAWKAVTRGQLAALLDALRRQLEDSDRAEAVAVSEAEGGLSGQP